MDERSVYVFLISRPNDKGYVWPAAYMDRELAEKAFGRVSEVAEVRFTTEGAALIDVPDCPRCGAAHWPQCPEKAGG